MSKSKDERLAEIHAQALGHFNAAFPAVRDERLAALTDRRFCDIPGAQWEGSWGDQFENRPKAEVNKVALAVQRIINEYRNNRISVDFVSRDGSKNDQLADICDGLYRADEADSNANEAKDNAFEEMVKGGYGAWRLCTDYENQDDDSTEQRIKIEPIFEADSVVFWDPNSRRYDKADARFCFVLSPMSPAAYEETFGKSPVSIQRDVNGSEFDWVGANVIYVAEYYRVEEATEVVYHFEGPLDGQKLQIEKDDLTDEKLAELDATGWTPVAKKRKSCRKVRKVVMDGAKVLEDYGHIAGDQIPIVPCYGKRSIIDGIERVKGHVRDCRDAQRIKNVQLSTLVDTAAQSGVEKPIFTPEQMMGHQMMWQEDNVKRYPYLLVNKITTPQGDLASGPVGYTKAPSIPPALAALIQISESDMADILGNQDSGDKLLAGISGKAVEQIQGRLDMQTFIYLSNFAKSEQRAGEIWLSMAKDIYIEEGRKMKTIDQQGTAGQIELKRKIVDDAGNDVFENDIEKAQFGVFVEVGPTYKSQRDAVTRQLVNMLPVVDPQTAQVLQSMIMTNVEGEGMGDIREFFRRRLVDLGVFKPTDEDIQRAQAAAQGQQTDPQADLANALAEESRAKAQKAQADALGAVADAELTRAKTVETLANVDQSQREQAAALIQGLMMNYGIRPDQLGELSQEPTQ